MKPKATTRNKYPLAHRQKLEGFCGVASVQSLLQHQFLIKPDQFSIAKSIGKYYRMVGHIPPYNNALNFVVRYGAAPSTLAFAIKKFAPKPVRVFASNQGDVYKLNALVQNNQIIPIIHTKVPEKNKLLGHYLTFWGMKQKKVRIFDPDSVVGGLKTLSIQEFNKFWNDDGQRWFLVALPSDIKLSREQFPGRYL